MIILKWRKSKRELSGGNFPPCSGNFPPCRGNFPPGGGIFPQEKEKETEKETETESETEKETETEVLTVPGGTVCRTAEVRRAVEAWHSPGLQQPAYATAQSKQAN